MAQVTFNSFQKYAARIYLIRGYFRIEGIIKQRHERALFPYKMKGHIFPKKKL